jgi:DNA-binding transcriptional MocR family regulator
MTTWRPKLSASRTTPLYRRLFEAMAADIEAGKLAPGTRLPPVRDLAHALSISVGAVTRAYDDAARRGLVSAHVGRGTFVVDRLRQQEARSGPIDLSINLAPIAPLDAIAETVAALRRSPTWAERLAYQPPCGLDVDRQAGAAWLARTVAFESVDWQRLLCCAGAQNAMAIAFAALCRPGDTIICEASTFSGVKTLAAQQGYRLHGVAMDEQGLRPQALDRAAAATGARVVYVLPTLQNPTARMMCKERRQAIARVARARDLWIVEGDVYAPYARDLALPPIATLAAERTVYVTSLSKILSPGLRAGFLLAPAGDVLERCVRAMRALMHSPGGVGAGIATDWIESGRADTLAEQVRAETAERTAAALDALQGLADPLATKMSLHLWLPMPALDAERAAARALTLGLRLTARSAFAVADSNAASGLRLCIGAAANRATLDRALAILKTAIKGEADDRDAASL